MRKFNVFATAGALSLMVIVFAAAPVWATTVTAFTAPGTISFTANNPGSNIAGSPNATVNYTINSTVGGNPTWTLSVGTLSTTFAGCLTVPTSAVQVRCSTATVVTAPARGATAACSVGSFTTLPSTIPGLQVASGAEPNSGRSIAFTINLAYQFADAWKYIANTCPLTVTYTVTFF